MADLVEVDLDGEPAYVTPAGADELARAVPLKGHVRLLPAFDDYVLAPHSHRRHTWPQGRHDRISRPAGWITPVVLVDGHVVAVWSHEHRAGHGARATQAGMAIEIEPLADVAAGTRTAIERQARGWEALLGAPVDVGWVERLRATKPR